MEKKEAKAEKEEAEKYKKLQEELVCSLVCSTGLQHSLLPTTTPTPHHTTPLAGREPVGGAAVLAVSQ